MSDGLFIGVGGGGGGLGDSSGSGETETSCAATAHCGVEDFCIGEVAIGDGEKEEHFFVNLRFGEFDLDESFFGGVVNGNAIDALEFVAPPVEAPFANLILFTLVSHILDEDHPIGEHESILLQALNIPKQVVVRVIGVREHVVVSVHC